MRGVTFLGDRKLKLTEFPDPIPGPHDVIVEIKASGLCGSDLKFYRGIGETASLGLGKVNGPIIAGHEPCGTVAAIGSAVEERVARVGARVMVHHYSGCGTCPHCQTGWSQMCVNGSIVYGVTGHGAHAPFMKVPANTLVPLPAELSFATGAAISCGTGTAYQALRRDPVEAIKTLTHGAGADRALDTSGTPEGRLAAVRATRPWGVVCLVGEGGGLTLDVSPDMLRKQLTVIGSWTFSTAVQEECARFVADYEIQVDHLFTHRWKLEEADEAYRVFDRQTIGKGVFLMS